MINGLPILDLMKSAMTHATERQKIYTQNISNANTPKYKAREIEPFSLKNAGRKSRKLQTMQTSAMHMPARAPNSSFKTFKDQEASEMSPDGNNVNVADQSVKISETNSNYQLVTNAYQKVTGILKSTIGDR